MDLLAVRETDPVRHALPPLPSPVSKITPLAIDIPFARKTLAEHLFVT